MAVRGMSRGVVATVLLLAGSLVLVATGNAATAGDAATASVRGLPSITAAALHPVSRAFTGKTASSRLARTDATLLRRRDCRARTRGGKARLRPCRHVRRNTARIAGHESRGHRSSARGGRPNAGTKPI